MVFKIGSKRSDCPISRFRFCGENVGRSFSMCSHDPIFGTNKIGSLETNRVNGASVIKNTVDVVPFSQKPSYRIHFILVVLENEIYPHLQVV